MAKQRTPNLQLVTINDSDTDSFFADWLENLGKIDAADRERRADLADEAARATFAEQNLAQLLDDGAAAVDLLRPGSDAWLKVNVNNVAYLSITRDANGAATSATVKWSDGVMGTYTATTVSTAFPGAVDAYTVISGTRGSMKTVTRGAVTRDSSTGAVTAAPALVVS